MSQGADKVEEGEATREALKVAGGSGMLLAAGVGNQALRMGTAVLLSWVLGVEGYGTFAYALALASVVAMLAPLGCDAAVVLFGARALKEDPEGLKGTLISCLGVSLIGGLLASLGLRLWAGTQEEASTRACLEIAAWAVAPWAVLMVSNRGLQAARWMKQSAAIYQLGLPLLGLLGYGVMALADPRPQQMLAVLAVATLITLLLALRWLWRRFGALLRDPSVRPRFAWGELMVYALPQSFAGAVVLLNARVDTLMVMELSGPEEVGLYRVANQLALMGLLAVTAVNTMFSPMVAQRLHAGETALLAGVIRTTTRWLILLAAPLYLVLALLPELPLLLFDGPYRAATPALLALLVGQVIHVACAPAARLIPMGGHAMLNLLNGLLALSLNLGLNWLWIPQHGSLGAAWASASSLWLWSTLRLTQAWWLYKVFPFSARSLVLLLGLSFGALGLVQLGQGAGWLLKAGLLLGGLSLWAGLSWTLGRAPEDRAAWDQIQPRLARLLGRGKPAQAG